MKRPGMHDASEMVKTQSETS